MNGLLNDIIQQGIASYGARYAESPSEPLSMKGKGYFGLLPSSEGFSTEISATDDQGMSYPLLVPTLTQQEAPLSSFPLIPNFLISCMQVL